MEPNLENFVKCMNTEINRAQVTLGEEHTPYLTKEALPAGSNVTIAIIRDLIQQNG